MNAKPSGLFTRLAWLLAGTIGLVVVFGAIALAMTSSRMSSEFSSHAVAVQISAADVLLAQGRETELADLGVQHAMTPPQGHLPALRVVRNVINEIASRWPGREPYIAGLRRPVLWLKASPPGTGWIGVPMVALRAPLMRSAVITIGAAALIVLLMASAYARSLTEPLRRLAQAAPAVVAGTPLPPLPRHSVRELVELNAALSRAAAEVRSNARERDVMLAALSHDLRTPLARLRLGLALSGDALDNTLREGMEADIDAIDAMSAQFIGFIRDGSDEPAAPVDLAQLLRELLALNRGNGGPPWEIDAPGHALLQGHPLALRRAIDNLVRNALRHGQAPYRASLSLDAGQWQLLIVDSGPGAPEHLLERLGEPFVRGNPARSDALGSGLGLASVKRIATQHGGSLSVRNRPDGGFEAGLRLPART
ncbi:MAG TPA: ATP-binding protein [Dyella sp.]|uniref:ATP-binding protein n=1 Tax=Dyella sp. TaxID=1869338 RepID=UPI002F92BFFA